MRVVLFEVLFLKIAQKCNHISDDWCTIEYNIGNYFKRCIPDHKFYWEMFCDAKSIWIDDEGDYRGSCQKFDGRKT
jgi:hypothetical protein